jgi:hypothetical protein
MQLSNAASRMLGNDPSALTHHGISDTEMREALERFGAGDRKALEDMIDKMSRTDHAARDANELSKAGESLGNKSARPSDDQTSSINAVQDDCVGIPSTAQSDVAATVDDGGERGSAMTGGGREDPRNKREPRASDRELNLDGNGPQLQADLQLHEGGVFVSEARVLPKAGNTTIDNTQIDAQYTQQLEQVLSNEQYPLHYEEFIRRYFLNLSEGL